MDYPDADCVAVGAWTAAAHGSTVGGTRHYSNETNARIRCRFEATTRLRWIGELGPYVGKARVWLDDDYDPPDQLPAWVDGYNAATGYTASQYTSGDLPCGEHAISIEVTGEKNDAANDYYVLVDAIDYVACTAPTPDAARACDWEYAGVPERQPLACEGASEQVELTAATGGGLGLLTFFTAASFVFVVLTRRRGRGG